MKSHTALHRNMCWFIATDALLDLVKSYKCFRMRAILLLTLQTCVPQKKHLWKKSTDYLIHRIQQLLMTTVIHKSVFASAIRMMRKSTGMRFRNSPSLFPAVLMPFIFHSLQERVCLSQQPPSRGSLRPHAALANTFACSSSIN